MSFFFLNRTRMGPPRPLKLKVDRGLSIPRGVFRESPAPVPLRKVQLKTRSPDRYKIAHSSPRNPNFQDGELEGRPPTRAAGENFKVKRKDGAQG